MKDTLLTLLLSNNQITTIATSTFGSHGDATEAWGLTELRTLKLAHGMHALEVNIYVYVIAVDITNEGLGIVLEVATELANGTNSLLPISIDLGNATLVEHEVDHISKPEAVLINMLL